MSHKAIITNKAPQAIGPYSQGILAGNTLYISGQIPLTAENVQIDDDEIYNQAIQCLRNIEAIVSQAGGSRKNIVKITIFLVKMKDFPVINEACAEFFNGLVFPARSTIEVKSLPKKSRIEIEAIGYL